MKIKPFDQLRDTAEALQTARDCAAKRSRGEAAAIGEVLVFPFCCFMHLHVVN